MTTIIKDKNDNNKQITLCNLLLRKNIETIVELVKIGENYDPLTLTLKRKLVDAKVLIDRWGLYTNVFVFSTEDKNRIMEELNKLEHFDVQHSSIWGADCVTSCQRKNTQIL